MTQTSSTEVLFYHLEHMPLERVLPGLLEKTIERGWRAVIQASTTERVEALDTLLWTYKEESFMPHGMAGQGHEDRQPIFLTTEQDNPNQANIRFFVDGADADDIGTYDRAVYLFDGRDNQAVEHARSQWRTVKEAGHAATYWQQTTSGKWEKKA